MARLGDVCEILNGYAFKSANYTDEGVRIIRISNVQKGYIEDNTPAFYPFDDINVAKYQLFEDDLLLSLTGNVGRVGRLDKKFLPVALNQRVACIRIKDSTALDKSFLFDFLNSDSFEQKCILSSKGVAQKNMSTEWLKDYKIPLPPLDEQCKIAAVLDKVSDLIAKRRQQLNKLDELVKSRFVEMFGDLKINEKSWKTKTFDEMSDLITDGEHATPRRKTEGIYLLSARNVLNHSLQLEDVDYIDQEEYDRIAHRIVPKKGDVLVSCSGTVGRCCSVPSNFKFQMVRSVALIRFNYGINPIFAEYMIASDCLQEQINRCKTMSSQANLFQGKIKTLRGFIPPIELQNEFADFVAQIDKSKYRQETCIGFFRCLEKSIRQEWL